MRIKTELLLRKMLRLDDGRIRLDQKLLTSLDSYNVAENDDRSVSGSESNPSVDNNQAISSRLLTKTGNLISALRKVNLQKKSLQDLSNTKYQMKLMNKLYKQKQKQLKARVEQADKDAQAKPVIPKPRPSTAPRNSQLRMTMPKREPMYRYSVDVGAVKVAPVTIQLMSCKDLDRSRLTELQQQQQQQHHSASFLPNQPRYSIINTNRQSANMAMAGQGVAMQSVNVAAESSVNSPRANRSSSSAHMTIVSSTVPQHQLATTPSPVVTKVSITPVQPLSDSPSSSGSSNLPPAVPAGYTSPAGSGFSSSVGNSKSSKSKRVSDDNTFFIPHAMPSSNYSGISSPGLSVVAPVMSHNILQTTITPSPSRPSTPKMYYHTLQPPAGPSSPLVAPLKNQGGGVSRAGTSGNSGGRARSSLPDILPLLASPTRNCGDSGFFSGVKKSSSLSVRELSAELMITSSPIGGSLLNNNARGQEPARASNPRANEQNNLFSPPSSARKL
ncbi:hypothetical protein EON65_08995 [archaeon]|nr:MAG: hypothetical protein EON65_08995 [archaeon]